MACSALTDLFFKSTALPLLSITVPAELLRSVLKTPPAVRIRGCCVHHQLEKNRLIAAKWTPVMGRRESLGFSMSFGLALIQSQPDNVQAAESDPPCELSITSSGLAYCDKIIGDGPEAIKGRLIKAHYLGKLENGKIFDSSYDRGKPLTFRVGVGEVIKGWDEGILGTQGIPPMLAGGKRTLRVPPEFGYGARGAGCGGGSCIIPANSVLLFDIEFIANI